MMSLLALTGLALGGFADSGSSDDAELPEDEFLYEHEGWSQSAVATNALDAEFAPAPEPTQTIDLERGDAISGFDPGSDILELEYTAAMGVPEVTITDFLDGSGASVALNGVVVADVAGAQGLDPNAVALIAV